MLKNLKKTITLGMHKLAYLLHVPEDRLRLERMHNASILTLKIVSSCY